jgi:hypothetical protein
MSVVLINYGLYHQDMSIAYFTQTKMQYLKFFLQLTIISLALGITKEKFLVVKFFLSLVPYGSVSLHHWTSVFERSYRDGINMLFG